MLNFSIGKARSAAWANAVLLAAMNQEQQQAHIRVMDNMVKSVATGIQNPAVWIKLLLNTIRRTEYDAPARTIGLIETVIV